MTFIEQLQQISEAYTPSVPDKLIVAKHAKDAADRLQKALTSEYDLFEKECLKAAQMGKRKCSMQFRRTRNSLPMLKLGINSDADISTEEKSEQLDELTAQDSFFTDDEAATVREAINEKLCRAGFQDASVLICSLTKAGFPQWCNRIEMSVSW